MSPDNRQFSPYVRKLMATEAAIKSELPHLAVLLHNLFGDFRGLALYLGDPDGVLGCAKSFSDDGTPTIIWFHAEDPLSCLIGLDKAIRDGSWRTDKREVERHTKASKAKKKG